MPAIRFRAEEPEIKDVPERKSRPPIITRCRGPIGFKRPDVRSQRFPDQGVILYQGIADDLPQVVVDELAAERINKSQQTNRCYWNDPFQRITKFHKG